MKYVVAALFVLVLLVMTACLAHEYQYGRPVDAEFRNAEFFSRCFPSVREAVVKVTEDGDFTNADYRYVMSVRYAAERQQMERDRMTVKQLRGEQ